MIEKAIGVMFMSREMTHKAHLKTKIYAQHMALAGFYDGIVCLADRLAEAYQGKYGIMNEIPVIEYKGDMSNPASMMETHVALFERMAMKVEDRCLMSIIDDISVLYYSTIYKLNQLR